MANAAAVGTIGSPMPSLLATQGTVSMKGQDAGVTVRFTAAEDPQGYTSFTDRFRPDKKRVLVESVGDTTFDWEGWRIRNPLPAEERAFEVSHALDAACVEAAVESSAGAVARAPYKDVLTIIHKEHLLAGDTGQTLSLQEPPKPPQAAPSSVPDPLVELTQQLRACQRELADREAQLRFVRDVYDRDVFRVKEANYRAHLTSEGEDGDGDGTIKPGRPLVASAIGSTVIAHQFFRLFFGQHDMVLVPQPDYQKLKADAAPPVNPTNETFVELKRLQREAAELVERHVALTESAKQVAMRADVAEVARDDARKQAHELRHTLQSVRLERDKLKGELAVASSTVAKLSAETASLPVLLSRATKELGHITDTLSGGVAYPAVAESVVKFTGIIDALDGYEEVNVKRLKTKLEVTERQLNTANTQLKHEKQRCVELGADVDRFQAQLRQMKKETKDACVDTYGECDDFTKMRDRLREASEKNAALVLECTNLRMKSWQDEERVNLSRRAAEEALSDVKDLEGKLDNSQRAYQAKDHLAMSLDLQLQELKHMMDRNNMATEDHRTRVIALTHAKAAVEARLTGVKTELTALTHSKANADQHVQLLQQQLATTREELTQHRELVSQQRHTLASLSVSLETKGEAEHSLRDELLTVTSKLESVESVWLAKLSTANLALADETQFACDMLECLSATADQLGGVRDRLERNLQPSPVVPAADVVPLTLPDNIASTPTTQSRQQFDALKQRLLSVTDQVAKGVDQFETWIQKLLQANEEAAQIVEESQQQRDEASEANGKLHLRLRDFEFEVEMMREECEMMAKQMEHFHEVERQASQAKVVAEAQAKQAHDAVERMVKRRDRNVEVTPAIPHVEIEPEAIDSSSPLFVVETAMPGDNTVAPSAYMSSPLSGPSTASRSPDVPHFLVQQLQDRLEQEEIRVMQLQQQITHLKALPSKVTVVDFKSYKETSHAGVQCRIEDEVAPPPKLTQVELHLPSGEYYYMPPSASPFLQRNPNKTRRGSSNSLLEAATAATGVTQDGSSLPTVQPASLAFDFASHAVVDDGNVSQIVKRRQSVQEMIRSRRSSSPFGQEPSSPQDEPENTRPFTADVGVVHQVRMKPYRVGTSPAVLTSQEDSNNNPLNSSRVVEVEEPAAQASRELEPFSDNPILNDLALLRRTSTSRPNTSASSRRNSPPRRPGSSPSSLSKKLAMAASASNLTSRGSTTQPRPATSLTSSLRKPSRGSAAIPPVQMSLPAAAALAQLHANVTVAHGGTVLRPLDVGDARIVHSSSGNRGSRKTSTSRGNHRSSSVDGTSSPVPIPVQTITGRRATSPLLPPENQTVQAHSRTERVDGVLMMDVGSVERSKPSLHSTSANSVKGTSLRDWGYSMGSDA